MDGKVLLPYLELSYSVLQLPFTTNSQQQAGALKTAAGSFQCKSKLMCGRQGEGSPATILHTWVSVCVCFGYKYIVLAGNYI